MEIKTAFATIIGIIMMVMVIVATIVIMAGFSQVNVEECKPASYVADTMYSGSSCGFINTAIGRREVFCKSDDNCFDQNNNLCCLTSQSGTDWKVKVTNGHCCNLTTKSSVGPSESCKSSTRCGACERWDWYTCSCIPTSCCLEEGSLILTPEGFKRIEDLKEEDYVIGYNNDKKILAKITQKSIHEDEFTLYFYKDYWFTGNHLVYLDNYENFKRVDELSSFTKHFKGKVYNIQTETHNYFGENGLLIHNK